MQEIEIRDLIPSDDSAFIIDSWIRSYYGHSFFAQQISKSLFFKKHSELIKKILINANVRLAVKKDDPNIIVGYIAFDKMKNLLHYVYIKEPFRNFGICKKLLMEHNFFDGTTITHLTMRGRKIQLKMGYVYSPYFD